MLKNFKNLKGAQVLSKNEQKAVNGGDRYRGDGNDDVVCEYGYHKVCGSRGWCGTVVTCWCEPNGPGPGGQGEVM